MFLQALPNRSFLRVNGDDAEAFLDGILSCTVLGLNTQEAKFGALLTPQGKILFDFFLIKEADGFLLDVNQELAADFLKRLMFYRLRAKVDLTPVDNISVIVSSHVPDGHDGMAIQDPRHPDLGYRLYSNTSDVSNSGSYLAQRIQLGIPEGDTDFAYGNAYPHETLMDQFAGVDFKKGCYVGQEVVSRMQHRGTAKKRVALIEAETDLPIKGTQITADGKPAGTLGSVDGAAGLAILRLDRIADASQVMAGDVAISVELPDWVNFGFPAE
ncbi:MAG: folate-binding protein YgfZ [Pseudomonadota bacterium]